MLNPSMLTLVVLNLEYCSTARSLSWLLMPWLLTSPGHQHPQYWLYRMNELLSSTIKNFNYLCHLSDEKWQQIQLDMSTARQRLKSPQSLSGTSSHPTMVTLVNIMVMNGWLTSFLFHVNRPSHSWDKAISDSDLEISTPRSRSWVWSKGKVIQPAQYHINSLRFHFTLIRPTIPEEELFRNLTLKHQRSRSWVRSKVKVANCAKYPTDALPFSFHINLTNHSWDMAKIVFNLETRQIWGIW